MREMPMSALTDGAFEGRIAIGTLLREALERQAGSDRAALIADTEQVSFQELAVRVSRAAGALTSTGFGPGTRLAISGHRTVDTVTLFLGAMVSGATALIVDPTTAEGVLIEQLAACGVPHPPIALTDLAWKTDAKDLPQLHGRDPAMIQLTSGSTGRSKGVLLSHGNLACNAAGILDRTGLNQNDRLLHVMPLHHTNGINNQIIAPLLAGATVVLHSRFQAERAVDALEHEAITIMTGVPTIFARMLPFVEGRRFGSLRFLRCGSAPLDEQLHLAIERAFGVPLVVSYGLSEATCTSVMNAPPPGVREVGSVGRVLRGQQIGIFRPGGGERLNQGEGEIRISGPAVMQGYLGSNETPVQENWLHTGDLGTLDDAGNLRITGRLKDLIIRGGENLSPREIETVILELPQVASCCVVGVPDFDLGEVPVAFVTGESPPPDADVRAHVRQRLSRIHEPARVVVVASLPENSVGKVDRKALAKLAQANRDQKEGVST